MCLVLYLGSDRQLPLIAWDESAPRFHIKDDDKDAQQVVGHLQKEMIYYVGSDNGCGCGFRQEYDYMLDDAEEIASKVDNQQQLYDYVDKCLEDEESIELYSCWSGDESLPKDFDRTITLDELLKNDFWFAERQRTVVSRAQTV